MTRDALALRQLCDDLARKLCSAPSKQLLEMSLRHSGYLRAPAPSREPPASAAPAPSGPRPISLWRPVVEGGELRFVRPPPAALGDGYWDRRTIQARKQGWRVCLFGESVAQGFLYAPHFTPGMVLEAQLSALRGEPCEVVDLSRSSESMNSLLTTMEAALQLEPDAMVVLAGNNWTFQEADLSPHIPAPGFRARYAAALRQGGIAGVRAAAQQQLAHKAGLVVARIAALARARGVPAVVVVPEVNLADWQSRQPVVWCDGEGTARWHELYARAVAHLRGGTPAAALELADELLAIDGGTCPSGYRVRAEAYRQLGRRQDQLEAARAEVDADLLPTMCYLHAPQATTLVRELLARLGREHGLPVVELATVFAEHLPGELPGRRMFLDYCHFTAEGTHVAMAAVAAELARRTTGSSLSWREVLARAPGPTPAPEVEAAANFGAALHLAHRLVAVHGKDELLQHYCRRALEASPELAPAMLALIELRAAPCPLPLAPALHQDEPARQLRLVQRGLDWVALDVELMQAMCAVLEERGLPARARLVASWTRWLAVEATPVELVGSERWRWDPNETFFAEALNLGGARHRAALRAAQPELAFAMVAEGTHPIELEALVRLPGLEGAPARTGVVELAVNGVVVAQVACDETWTRLRATVSAQQLTAGPNRVTLCWPPPPPAKDAALRAALARLERELPADLHPVFGEVFSLTARRASSSSEPTCAP